MAAAVPVLPTAEEVVELSMQLQPLRSADAVVALARAMARSPSGMPERAASGRLHAKDWSRSGAVRNGSSHASPGAAAVEFATVVRVRAVGRPLPGSYGHDGARVSDVDVVLCVAQVCLERRKAGCRGS